MRLLLVPLLAAVPAAGCDRAAPAPPVPSTAAQPAAAGARVELWPELAGQGHPDGQRATVLTAPTAATGTRAPRGQVCRPFRRPAHAGPRPDGWRVAAALG